jgi:hypothetical protein
MRTNLNCLWCGVEFLPRYRAIYCSDMCRYAYKNECVFRRAQLRGITIRELHRQERLEKDLMIFNS